MTSSDVAGGRKRSYPILLLAVESVFNSALEKGGMNRYQAFAFTYDEMERLLNVSSPWIRCATHIALFKVAHANGVHLKLGDPFESDVRDELRDSLNAVDISTLKDATSVQDLGNFERDAELVHGAYLC